MVCNTSSYLDPLFLARRGFPFFPATASANLGSRASVRIASEVVLLFCAADPFFLVVV